MKLIDYVEPILDRGCIRTEFWHFENKPRIEALTPASYQMPRMIGVDCNVNHWFLMQSSIPKKSQAIEDQHSMETIEYQELNKQVSWCGIRLSECDEFKLFLSDKVAPRLIDQEGEQQYEAHLRGLVSTGFENENLEEFLGAQSPDELSWAAGEAIAEAWLTHKHGVIWPWNMARDKRNRRASLAGADLVGFESSNGQTMFVLGEVKTSSQRQHPPSLMNGRSGMIYQLDTLATNLASVRQLLFWLFFRCKNTPHQDSFNSAFSFYLRSNCSAISLFGVLIRDTETNVMDLQSRGRALAHSIQVPTSAQLIAIYLPFAISDLPGRVTGGIAS